MIVSSITPAGIYAGASREVADDTILGPGEVIAAPPEGYEEGQHWLHRGGGVWELLDDEPVAQTDTRSPRERGWRMEKVWRNRLFTVEQQARVLAIKAAADICSNLNAKRMLAHLAGQPDGLSPEEAAIADNPMLMQMVVAFNEDKDAALTELALGIWAKSVLGFAAAGVFGDDEEVIAAEVERVTNGYFPPGSPEADLPVNQTYVIG